ncbi:MAG: glycoside hydrolase family 5 protein [Bacteroidaceae bacterium]|nr:glycoside hydrolase family 5 protein [Bacteroidaceae bacterium]
MRKSLIISMLLLVSCAMFAQIPPITNDEAPEGMKKNALGIIKDINIGWNLGNQLESLNDRTKKKLKDVEMEEGWGNPRITPEIIKAVKDAGFNAIRIPVRWYPHCDKNFNVDPAWMKRVHEVVDYAYNLGMYVMINTHHDAWYDRWRPDHLPVAEVNHRMHHLWTQIANEFKDYDERLIFAGVNEMIVQSLDGKNDFNSEPTVEEQKVLQGLYQEFIDAVRATGGNNKWRVLTVASWAANPYFALKFFRKPFDVVPDRLMLEVHYYQPWWFCAQTNGEEGEFKNQYFWGKPYEDQPCSSNTQAEVKRLFGQLKSEFIDKGIPVILGEMGAVHHNPTKENAKWNIDFKKCEESRAYYMRYIIREAKDNGFSSFYWDNNYYGGDEENFAIFDRDNGMKVHDQATLDAIMLGAAEGVFPF